MAEQQLEKLKQKYQSVLDLVQNTGVRLSHIHIQDGKLFIQGEAPSDEAKNKVWDEIKLVDPKYSNLPPDTPVNPTLGGSQQPSAGGQSGATQSAGAAAGGILQTYTVQPGDSLSTISQNIYGSPGQYMKI